MIVVNNDSGASPERVPKGGTQKSKNSRILERCQGAGGGHTGRGWGGGVRHKIWHGEGLGRRPDPCLLVPNASRQDAEAN